MRQEKGITLVALVITIIVMLILASVSISMVLNQNGIINRAKQARDATQNEQKVEQNFYNQFDNYVNESLNQSYTP